MMMYHVWDRGTNKLRGKCCYEQTAKDYRNALAIREGRDRLKDTASATRKKLPTQWLAIPASRRAAWPGSVVDGPAQSLGSRASRRARLACGQAAWPAAWAWAARAGCRRRRAAAAARAEGIYR
jgi:hypothetical protein